MKSNQLIIVIALMISSLMMSAQISEQELPMSQGTHSALVTELQGATAKEAEKVWKKYGKEFGKVRRDKKHKEYYLLDAIIPSIDPEYAVSVFINFEEFADMTRANLWVKSDGAFVNATINKEYIVGASKLLTDYSNEVRKVVIAKELKSEEKNLKGLKKELSKLEKRQQRLNKDIEKAKEVIRRSEEELKQNATAQEEKKKEIKGQEEKVSGVSKKLNNVGKQ